MKKGRPLTRTAFSVNLEKQQVMYYPATDALVMNTGSTGTSE